MKNIFETAIPRCYFCGELKNEIIMNTVLTEKHAEEIKNAHGKCIDKEPCAKCKELMKQGVMLIKVKENDPDYRLGQIVGIKDEAIKKIFKPEQAEQLLKMRAGFIGEELWKQIGLPEGEENV